MIRAVEEQVTRDEIRHPALTGEPWPVIDVRVCREDSSPRAASWRPAPHTALDDVLLSCTWLELERLAGIATGLARAGVYVTGLGAAEPDRCLVLCLSGTPDAVQVEGPLTPVAEVVTARTRAAALRVAASHREAGRPQEAQLWRARARRILKDSREARRGRSVRADSAGLPPRLAPLNRAPVTGPTADARRPHECTDPHEEKRPPQRTVGRVDRDVPGATGCCTWWWP
ncbi:hypothetical protein [Streptomyces scabiei]|uniref:hypothetical protein n=3 Tax=Streptomyces scabiei TaxID=1930 RepID=UPI001B311811|nr:MULTISPECIES: hypothetical protein [Streptomyces]MBP5896306.1 hypothetical protein [Streptomyces sp. LBUM 1481]MBP5910892.1 hypothetical protein [Streptomyces sp. LBUM 1486]MBP5926644.1 hypothetical protein [Streptomyces sp. LBUM 1483]MDX2540197.1 hypothetical protein [Streptomyces scabiei]MDX2688284.1 hypothetical protein [Streptomyces scabiei]